MLPHVGTLGIGLFLGVVLTGGIATRVVGLLYPHMVEQVDACDRSLVGITLPSYEPMFHTDRPVRRTAAS